MTRVMYSRIFFYVCIQGLKKVPAAQPQPLTSSASSEAAADISSTFSIDDDLDIIKLSKHLNVHCLIKNLFKTFCRKFSMVFQKEYSWF